jgi:two-component system, OmpR family, sensor kinase
MTLRWRITILTAVMIAIASSVIGLASYLNVSQAQMTSIDSSLQNSLGSNPKRVLERALPRGGNPNDFYSAVAIGVIDSAGTVAVLRPAGTQGNPEEFPTLPVEEIQSDSNQAISFTDVSTGESYRLLARPAGRDFLVIAVTSLADFRTTMNQILFSTILFVLGVTILGALASWLIVRKFFAPVESMIASASAIAQGDISQRVPNAPAGTELGDLSVSLNTMINSLTESITRVETSEQTLRNFISDASHEIRTPLTVIRGYIEILRAESSGASERDIRAIGRIDSESQRLERLVTSLLELDTQESSSIMQTTFRLDELIALHFADLESISPRPITYQLEELTIEGDPSAWEQLLRNIVQNISRYTPAQSEVGVELRSIHVNNQNWVEFVVNDCGPGIPVEKRTEVFSRFSRLDPSRSTQSGGFGLGMSIVKAVVDAHFGLIELGESPCGGLQIRIRVPQHNI